MTDKPLTCDDLRNLGWNPDESGRLWSHPLSPLQVIEGVPESGDGGLWFWWHPEFDSSWGDVGGLAGLLYGWAETVKSAVDTEKRPPLPGTSR